MSSAAAFATPSARPRRWRWTLDAAVAGAPALVVAAAALATADAEMAALDAHKLAPLLQSLEALALAGSEVDDAAREQVWDSLSPAARQMAQALFAGRPRESAAAVVTPPRTFCGVERFPGVKRIAPLLVHFRHA